MTIGRIPSVEGGIQPTLLTTKGDIIVATGNATLVRQGVGTNNQVLMADSAEADGIKYANEATATLTTTGDVLYASAANTLARRAIGTTGQILTVSGGLPTWATPAAAGSLTLLSTTTLSGASTTISSISQSYTNLYIVIKNVVNAAASKTNMRINGITTGAYSYGWIRTINGTTASNTNMNTTYFEGIIEDTDGGSNGSRGQAVISIPQYTNTTSQSAWWQGTGGVASTSYQSYITGGGNFVGTAVTSLTFISQSSTFSSGSVFIYGVN